jgi:peptidoglycan hydrolase-like protein with peptidoglycan-binding domain
MSRPYAPVAVASDLRALEAPRFAIAASVLRALVRRPLDSIALAAMVAGASVVVVNALYLQKGPHPAPILAVNAQAGPAGETTGSLIMMPRPRPTESDAPAKDAAVQRSRTQIVTDIQRELARRGFYEGTVDGIYGPKMDAAIREFEQAAGLKSTGEPTEALLSAIARSLLKTGPERTARSAPPASPAQRRPEAVPDNPTPTPRVAAIQRALADFGYGQIKPHGVFDGATKSAIEKFERERKLPITGQMSDRLTRELSAVTGRPLE